MKFKHSLFAIGILLSVGCSTKKNNVFTRTYHKIGSMYNPIFHGNEALQKEIVSLNSSYEDNFTQILRIEKIAEPMELSHSKEQNERDEKAQMFKRIKSEEPDSGIGNLGRAKIKALTAIEDNSIRIKGKEFNHDIAKAYLLLGKAQYYSGEYLEALISFNYILNDLSEYKEIETARMWVATTQARLDNEIEAQKVFNKLIQSESKKEEKLLHIKKYSQFLIDTENYDTVFQVLERTLPLFKKKEQDRMRFIQGQLLLAQGKNTEALSYFIQMNKSNNLNLFIKSKIAIAQIYPLTADNYVKLKNNWEALLKNGKYDKYHNELYFSLAKLSERADKKEAAAIYYTKSLAAKSTDKYIRSAAYQAKAEELYSVSKYIESMKYYDSAIGSLPDKKTKEVLEKWTVSLKRVAEKEGELQRKDSLLRLAGLSKEVQKKEISAYITRLKEESVAEKKALLKEEKKALNKLGEDFQKEKENWYFNSLAQKTKGELGFKKKWGSLSLVDNWKFELEKEISRSKEGLAQEKSRSEDKFSLDFYLDQIPRDSVVIEGIRKERDKERFSLAGLYQRELKDKSQAVKTLETLLSSPPFSEELTQRSLYELYKLTKENKYKSRLEREYPNSLFTRYLNEVKGNLIVADQEDEAVLYKKAWTAYSKHKYFTAKKYISKAKNQERKGNKWNPKFALLEAYCIGKEEGKSGFLEALKAVIIRYPETKEAVKSLEIINQLEN